MNESVWFLGLNEFGSTVLPNQLGGWIATYLRSFASFELLQYVRKNLNKTHLFVKMVSIKRFAKIINSCTPSAGIVKAEQDFLSLYEASLIGVGSIPSGHYIS